MCFTLRLAGQDRSRMLRFESVDGQQQLLDRFGLKTRRVDSLSLEQTLEGILAGMQTDGYLSASIDSIVNKPDTVTAFIYAGKQYAWGDIQIIGVPEAWGRSFRADRLSRNIAGSGYTATFDRILQFANNHGFPFAKVELDSVSIADDRFNGTARFEQGPLIRFDSLEVNGPASRQRYMSYFLKIKQGALYSDKKVNRIAEYFEGWPYYQMTQPAEMLFHNNNARVFLEVERIKANRFDGIIGFLPNASREGGTLITGELNLELLNAFETGKEFRLHWRRLREESQFLDLEIKLPHFVRTPLDLFAGFQQLKEDSTFINRDARIGAGVNLNSRSDFRFFANYRSADLLSSEGIASDPGIPEIIDFRLQRYGWGYTYRSLSTTDVSDTGWLLDGEFSLGNKKVRENPSLDPAVYDSIPLNSVLYQIDLEVSYQLRLGRFITLFQRVRSGQLFNENLFLNDMYRLGGLGTLRGFNENEFFASNYLLSNLELRLFFEQSSFLYLFYDQSMINTKLGDDSDRFAPKGLGLGMQLFTRSGNFKFAYALGHSKDQPFDFSQSKIHFGIISRF